MIAASSSEPAWNTVPSYFVYGDKDKNIPAHAQVFMAERAHAKKTVVVKDASHGVMVSNPKVVASLIETAATAK
ncbi:alpha/beta hydrolase [Pseudomonas hormoni]|uniref:Alpha/beta hydrolase n=1 Tax=Pseudomonas hormoni TaxID=3093767 RepID=A0ABX8F2D7_9PSED|nr:alpha/beta hydrolase [Pseudomonas hormoni]